MERSAELEQLARDLYDAVSTGDPAAFEGQLRDAPGTVVIGTAPGEWWGDARSALRAIREQMRTAGTSVRVTAGDLQGWREGEVGWVSDRPTIQVGASRAACRHTSVYVREQGHWKLVQQHFSIGVENAAAFGPDAGTLG